LTSEVSVVGASTSLTMGYHYGPSADLLVLVCVSAFLFGITRTDVVCGTTGSSTVLGCDLQCGLFTLFLHGWL
jgi:hypothetical protein